MSKKSKTLDEIKNILEEQKNSGSSVFKFCNEKGISTRTFYHWKERLFSDKKVIRISPSNPIQKQLTVDLGLSKVTLSYSNQEELIEILGAIKNV